MARTAPIWHGSTFPMLLDVDGRVEALTTADASIRFEQYDLGGRPHLTTQTRYKNHSAFTAKEVLDQYSQTHEYNEHGERTNYTMPSASSATANGWTTAIEQTYDAAGNIKSMQRLSGGGSKALLMDCDYRGAARPIVRTVQTKCDAPCAGTPILRSYAYNANGQLSEMSVKARGNVVAGSQVAYDENSLQIARVTLLGLSGGRANFYSYDARGRLQKSSFARANDANAAEEQLDEADFRHSLDRKQIEPADPPSLTFTHGPGHKITGMTRGDEKRTFSYAGAERVDDGRFTYVFDARGRLTTATEKSGEIRRRINYEYSATDRIVGRRAEYTTSSSSDWKLEDRGSVLDSDALPADTTFVWDPLTDNLLAIYKAGANASTDTNGGLVRQIIHGGLAYDDPIEVTAATEAGLTRLYPIFDEAGAGSLQAILNESGEVIARPILEGAYGEDETVLTGFAIDRIAIEPKRDSTGALTSVEITMRATEPLDPKTVAEGGRLAAVAGETVVRTSPVSPTLDDSGSTLQWTLTATQWTALTDAKSEMIDGQAVAPTSLSIAATDALRSVAWSSSSPLLPASVWAASRPIFDSVELPVEYREPLSDVAIVPSVATSGSIGAVSGSGSSGVLLYDIESPGSLTDAARASNDFAVTRMVSSTLHALPFGESATKLNFARGRWLDIASGTFLSPDAASYADSSNLAAYCAADPVNDRDPTGDVVVLLHGILSTGSWAKEMSRGLNLGWFAQNANSEQDVIRLVTQRSPGKAFGFRNALRAGVLGYLDAETTRAGQRTAHLLERLRRHLERSKYHKTEPINVIAHSHGSAVLLAAARSSGGRLRLGTVVLAGSDLNPGTDLSALTGVAHRVISYYSTEDDTTGVIHAAGGGHGFNHGRVEQRLVPAVDHSRGESEARRGVLAWMTDDLSRRYYAADTAIATGGHDIADEDWNWIKEYIEIRQEMSLEFEQLPIP